MDGEGAIGIDRRGLRPGGLAEREVVAADLVNTRHPQVCDRLRYVDTLVAHGWRRGRRGQDGGIASGTRCATIDCGTLELGRRVPHGPVNRGQHL